MPNAGYGSNGNASVDESRCDSSHSSATRRMCATLRVLLHTWVHYITKRGTYVCIVAPPVHAGTLAYRPHYMAASGDSKNEQRPMMAAELGINACGWNGLPRK